MFRLHVNITAFFFYYNRRLIYLWQKLWLTFANVTLKYWRPFELQYIQIFIFEFVVRRSFESFFDVNYVKNYEKITLIVAS